MSLARIDRPAGGRRTPLSFGLTRRIRAKPGEVHYGRVPEFSVVVPGGLPGKDGGPGLACAVIVKRVDERTRSKTSINELLRD
jgi:2,3,4,5-tetrahydropyridine-2-carboxylate N-succinyltransferase